MTEVSLDTLKANRIISKATKKVKIFGNCELSQAMPVTGINVTKGAKKSIEKAGGTIAHVEVKSIREKFLKTTKKTNQTNSQSTEEYSE